MGFKWFLFAFLGCDAHLESAFSLKYRPLLEIDQDNLRTKLNWCCGASHEHLLRFLVLLPCIPLSRSPPLRFWPCRVFNSRVFSRPVRSCSLADPGMGGAPLPQWPTTEAAERLHSAVTKHSDTHMHKTLNINIVIRNTNGHILLSFKSLNYGPSTCIKV